MHLIGRERARDRHIVALKEELSLQQQRKGEKRRHVERLRLTREQEGKRSRQNASQLATQPPIIMVTMSVCLLNFIFIIEHPKATLHVGNDDDYYLDVVFSLSVSLLRVA